MIQPVMLTPAVALPAARSEKAAKVFPRPVAGLLRPVVRGQTLRYNTKRRLGRGFSHEELKVPLPRAQSACSCGVALSMLSVCICHRVKQHWQQAKCDAHS